MHLSQHPLFVVIRAGTITGPWGYSEAGKVPTVRSQRLQKTHDRESATAPNTTAFAVDHGRVSGHMRPSSYRLSLPSMMLSHDRHDACISVQE